MLEVKYLDCGCHVDFQVKSERVKLKLRAVQKPNVQHTGMATPYHRCCFLVVIAETNENELKYLTSEISKSFKLVQLLTLVQLFELIQLLKTTQ